MTALANRQFRLASRPVGMPTRENWSLTSEPVAAPGEGDVLIKVDYISLDPAMRGWMNEGKSYIRPVAIGEVMRAGGAGHVIESRHPDFKPGDAVTGNPGVQEYAVVRGKDLVKADTSLAPLPVYLNVLGMPGMTGYFGLLEVGEPKPGQTVVVSGAAGAVGALVGQVAKIKGCRVVGIAGGPEKCRHVVEKLGFDACVDYKSEDVRKALRGHCPDGINIYFDNVGGDILDACLANLAMRARIIICGAISQYNNTTPVKGPANYLSLLVYRARMEGIVVFDYADRFHLGVKEMSGWIREGKLISQEDIVEGIETFPETLLMLFKGENMGKLVLKV